MISSDIELDLIRRDVRDAEQVYKSNISDSANIGSIHYAVNGAMILPKKSV